jgi:MFS family permease
MSLPESTMLPEIDAVEENEVSTPLRLLISLFIGTTIEWYDFLIYGFLAPVVFNTLFFPQFDPMTGTLAVYGLFAVGFLARPIGGVVFGHYGDRIGRKPIMIVTLSMMGLTTAALGLLPTFQTIGIWAPVAVLILRFAQGFALGGESTGAPVFVAESTAAGRRGFLTAIIQSGGQAGIVLGTVATSLIVMLPSESLLTWGWRIPFLLSLILAAVGYYIRSNTEESPSFLAAVEIPSRGFPIVNVIKREPKALIIVFFCSIADSITPFFIGVFGVNYAVQTLHMDRAPLLYAVAIGNFLGIFLYPIYGTVSDRIGRKPVIATGLVLMAAYMLFAFFPLLHAGGISAYIGLALPVILLSPIPFSVNGSFYAELFEDTSHRFSGAALSRQLGTAFGGGATPLIAASLVAASGGGVMWVVVYYGVVCAMSLCAVFWARETGKRSL